MGPRPAYSVQDRSSLLQCQFTSQGNMGDSEPPGILCESCSCIIHTIKSTELHVHLMDMQLCRFNSVNDTRTRLTQY